MGFAYSLYRILNLEMGECSYTDPDTGVVTNVTARLQFMANFGWILHAIAFCASCINASVSLWVKRNRDKLILLGVLLNVVVLITWLVWVIKCGILLFGEPMDYCDGTSF